MQDLKAHAEHSLERGLPIFTAVAYLWLHVLLWSGVFLLIAAFSAVADVRLLSELRRGHLRSLSRDVVHGFRAFLGLLRDRQTPSLGRALLAVALVYWRSSPWEVFPDDWPLPGFLDELVVTVAATKGFVYLCPEWLVKRHAVLEP